MKSDKEFLDGIYQKYNQYQKDNDKKFFQNIKLDYKRKNKFIKFVSVAAVLFIIFSFIVVNHQNIEILEQNNIDLANAEQLSLASVDSFENFYNIIKNMNSEDETDILYDKNIEMEVSKSESITTSDNNASDTTRGYSTTNTQVDGVDEADIVKTDGKYVYYISNKKIVIIDIQNPSSMKIIAQIDFFDEAISAKEMYVQDNKLIALCDYMEYSYGSGRTVYQTADIAYTRNDVRNKAIAIIYDLQDIANPKEIRRVEVDGNYVSSRMIGDSVYFVANKYISVYPINVYPIEQLKQEDYQLKTRDTVISNEERCIDFKYVYCFEDIESSNYLSIVGFNVNDNQAADIKTFLGAGNCVYASTRNMYIAKNKSVYDIDTR